MAEDTPPFLLLVLIGLQPGMLTRFVPAPIRFYILVSAKKMFKRHKVLVVNVLYKNTDDGACHLLASLRELKVRKPD